MTIEEAAEWCRVHFAQIRFTETYSIQEGSRDVCMVEIKRPRRIECVGDTLQDAVLNVQKHLWQSYEYQKMFRPEWKLPELPAEREEATN